MTFMQIFRIRLIFFRFFEGLEMFEKYNQAISGSFKDLRFSNPTKMYKNRSNPKNIYLHKRHLTFFFWNILNFQRFEFLIFFSVDRIFEKNQSKGCLPAGGK